MRDRERTDTLVGVLKAICDDARSDESKEHMKMVGRELYIRAVHVPLALILHPIAMTRAGLMIGSKETQEKDWETLRKVPQPSFLRQRPK